MSDRAAKKKKKLRPTYVVLAGAVLLEGGRERQGGNDGTYKDRLKDKQEQDVSICVSFILCPSIDQSTRRRTCDGIGMLASVDGTGAELGLEDVLGVVVGEVLGHCGYVLLWKKGGWVVLC